MFSEQLTIPKNAERLAPSGLRLALEAFLLDAEARHLTVMSLRFYRQQLEPFLIFLAAQDVVKPEGITAPHIRSYLVQLQRRGLADASQHAAARAIRAFCNFMVREELLAASPMRKVQMPKQEKIILPAFSPDEVKKLLAACKSSRDAAVVFCLLDTGCRAREFIGLDVGDVDMKTGTVKIRFGKGRKQRLAFLGVRARKALLKHLIERGAPQTEEPLWLSQKTGDRLTVYGLRLLCRRLGLASGVANCHPHTFRRTFALWSLRSGMDIYALQQLMGHSDLQILRRYLALQEDDLKEAHRKHGAVDSML